MHNICRKKLKLNLDIILFIMYILFIHSVSVHIVFVFIFLRCLRALAGYAYSSLCLLYVLPMSLLYYLLQPTKKNQNKTSFDFSQASEMGRHSRINRWLCTANCVRD